MKKILLPYFAGYVLLSIALLDMFFTYSQVELHMLLNSCHTPAGDAFFRHYTILAEWPLYIIGLIPLLFKRYWWTGVYAISEIVAGLIITILKKIYELPRPALVFESIPDAKLPVVEGVTMHYYDSFPSGHACTFFVFFTMLALLFTMRSYSNGLLHKQAGTAKHIMIGTAVLMLLIMAVLGAYSRVYLSQHFFIDIYIGSLIGITVTPIVAYIFRKQLLK